MEQNLIVERTKKLKKKKNSRAVSQLDRRLGGRALRRFDVFGFDFSRLGLHFQSIYFSNIPLGILLLCFEI